MRFFLLVLVIFLSNAQLLAASSRCQCEYDKWIGDCSASVKQTGNWVNIISDTQTCSRVDWIINGDPQVTIVTDGAESEELLNYQKNATLVVQSCKVCQDAMYPDYNENDSKPNSNSQTTLSPFHGNWESKGRNMFGIKKSTSVIFKVQNNVLTGTWGGTNVTGTVSANSADIQIHDGGASMTIVLETPDTISYNYGFGGGKLHRR